MAKTWPLICSRSLTLGGTSEMGRGCTPVVDISARCVALNVLICKRLREQHEEPTSCSPLSLVLGRTDHSLHIHPLTVRRRPDFVSQIHSKSQADHRYMRTERLGPWNRLTIAGVHIKSASRFTRGWLIVDTPPILRSRQRTTC